MAVQHLPDPHGSTRADADHSHRAEQLRAVIERLQTHLDNDEVESITDDDLLVLADLESRLTRATQAEEPNDRYLLDNESENVPTQRVVPNVSRSGPHNNPPLGHEGLVVVIRKKVGRATTYRPRATYFPPVAEVDAEEQAARTQRSQEANDRRAVRRAADFCIEHKCLTWVTLTFDDLHIDLDPVDECRNYLARVSEIHRAETGEYLEYRAVVADHDGRPHLHGLLSEDIDFETLREEWANGAITEFEVISREDVEAKVSYMMRNIANNRLTPQRFLSSKGGMEAPLVVPTTGPYDARSIITDVVSPNPVHITSAQLFGGNPRITYRFDPIDD